MTEEIRIVFKKVKNKPNSFDLIFIEVENEEGKSIKVGTWHTDEDGYLELRIPIKE